MSMLYRECVILIVFFVLGTSYASAENVVSFNPQTVEMLQNSSQNVTIVMDEVPNGLSGFNITISILDPKIAEITAVTFPSWNVIPRNSTLPSSFVWIKAIDLSDQIISGNTNVLLATITLKGKKAGTTDLNILNRFYDPDGSFNEHLTPAVNKGNINILDKESPDPRYSIFKSVIGPDEDGDCIVNSAGDKIPYRIVVKNEGNVNLTNVTVKDPMIQLTKPIGDYNSLGVLNPGEIWVYTGIYKLTSDDIKNGNGNVTNTATVTCNELPEKSSSVDTPIAKKADLSIYKSIIEIDEAGDKIINKPGDVIRYLLAVKNNGNFDLTRVSISDPMVTLTGLSRDHNDPKILNSGEIWVFTGNYTVTLEDIESNGGGDGFIENTATVSCNELSNESSTIVMHITQTPPVVVNNLKYLVANFSTNTTSGNAPLSVQFSDLSQNAVSRSWDFNNDGTVDSSDAVKTYTYTVPGTYTSKLTVSNANETNSKTAIINVFKATSSSSSDGGSGGSGGSSSSRAGGGGSVLVSSSTVSSTSNTTGNDKVIQTQNNTQIKQKNEDTANLEQTPKLQNNNTTPAKETKNTQGFELVCGITGLLAVFLYKRK